MILMELLRWWLLSLAILTSLEPQQIRDDVGWLWDEERFGDGKR